MDNSDARLIVPDSLPGRPGAEWVHIPGGSALLFAGNAWVVSDEDDPDLSPLIALGCAKITYPTSSPEAGKILWAKDSPALHPSDPPPSPGEAATWYRANTGGAMSAKHFRAILDKGEKILCSREASGELAALAYTSHSGRLLVSLETAAWARRRGHATRILESAGPARLFTTDKSLEDFYHKRGFRPIRRYASKEFWNK